MIKASELAGPALRWAVALCQQPEFVGELKSRGVSAWACIENFHPDTDWSRGGPIIERAKIAVWFHTDYGCWCAAGIDWMDADVDSDVFLAMPDAFRGPTPLIAAMRCYCCSKLGDIVDVPEELCQSQSS